MVEGETLVVDDRDSLVALWLVMGVIFDVGARTPVTTKWCVESSAG